MPNLEAEFAYPQTSDTANIAWQKQTVPLKAYAGDLTVCVLPLDLLVAETAFIDLPSQIDLEALPPLASDIQGYLIRSCRADDKTWRMRRRQGHLLYAPRRYDRFWTSLDDTFDTYLSRLSGKTRGTLRRKVRKFEAEAGGRDFRVYRTAAEMNVFHDLARQISEKSYQERLMGVGLPTTSTFLEDMRRKATENRVRGYLLFFQGQPAAYTYAPVEDGAVIYDYTGFDPAMSQLSPGTVLQFLLLEDLFAEQRFKMFDFTEGEGAHKALFGTHHQACMDLYVLRRGIGAWGSAIIQTAIELSTEKLAEGFDRIGVKRHLKGFLRGF